MPPAILQDSDDDEGQDLSLEAGDVDCLADGAPERSHDARNLNNPDSISGFDGTNDHSTNSTECLERQITSAERALFTKSVELSVARSALALASSGSPALQGNKRRHTIVSDTDRVPSQEKRIKRTQTFRTYTSRRGASTTLNEENIFARFKDDNAAPGTSQSAQFSDHCGGDRSSALPGGSIQANFVRHEPAVMFRDTGDTIADNESSQQRMIEQVLGSKAANSTSQLKLAESDEQRSSPFPWTASLQTQSAKSARSKADALVADAGEAELTEDKQDEESNAGNRCQLGHDELLQQVIQKLGEPRPTKAAALPAVEVAGGAAPERVSTKQWPSPVVQIINNDELAPSPLTKGPTSTSKAAKGGKRKLQEDFTDPPDSDDIAVGLPKERYKPRLSRRRATQVLEGVIDYSVRPERAGKLKRAKTSNDAKHHAAQDEAGGVLEVKITQDPPRLTSRVSKRKKTAKSEEPVTAVSDNPAESNERLGVQGKQVLQHPEEEEIELVKLQSPKQETSASKASAGISVSAETQKGTNNNVFVRPASKARPSQKARRSHTTIYEDHVDFAGPPQPSPTLSQQQAKRKSALQDIQNEAIQIPSQRKRRVVADEDEDTEVQQDTSKTARAMDDLEDEPAPKKCGRGKPPKSAAKQSKSISEEKVLDDSELEDERMEAREEDDGENSPPKKKKGGRLPKRATKDQKTAVDAEHIPLDGETSEQIGSESTKPKTITCAPESIVARTPTASPVKPAASLTEPPPDRTTTKPSPTSHSPIKSSSGISYRVGLSKRQRIPSLLRLMKAPKR